MTPPDDFFASLERELQIYWPSPPLFETRWEVISLLVTFLGACLAFASIVFDFGLIISAVGLVVEIAGFVFYTIHFARTEWASIRKPGLDLAVALDRGYGRYKSFMATLSKTKRDEIEDRLRFSKHRMDVSGRKMALLVGSFEKLGLLPALVGVLLQIRSVMQDSQQQGWLWFVIGAGTIAIYLASLFLTRLAFRQAFYVNVLETALDFIDARKTPQDE